MPHKCIRATSSYKLLQASYKLFKRLMQACDKPAISCFIKENFRLYFTKIFKTIKKLFI